MIFEDIGSSAAGLVAEPSIRFRADDDFASARVFTPEIDAAKKGSVLPPGKSAWEPDAEFVEQLHGIDAGETFEPPAYDRPHPPQRLDTGMAAFGVDRPPPARFRARTSASCRGGARPYFFSAN